MTDQEPSAKEREAVLQAELLRLEQQEHHLRAENEGLIDALRSLEESQEQRRKLYDLSPVASMTVDRNGMIQTANARAVHLLEQPPRSLFGTLLRHRIVTADRLPFMALLSACGNGSTPAASVVYSCEVGIAGVDGTVVQYRLCGQKLSPDSFLLTLTDLSERDRATAQRLQLLDKAREAEAAAAARDQFIAMLSHELRTPLTPVLVAVTALLRLEGIPQQLQKTFSMIARNIESERRLIDDLLDTSRIVHRKLKLEQSKLDVHDVLEETLDGLAPEIKRKNLLVTSELTAERQWMSGDAVRLRQVFWNLLQNAIKFTGDGGRIDIRSWNREHLIAIEVSDSGMGISPEMLPLLFAPFQQARTESMPSRGGLGLGLAICRGIVELHGGKIAAFSPGLGKGARFVVDLPTMGRAGEVLATRTRLDSRPIAAPVVDGAARPVEGPALPTRILLVEDDVDTADTLAELLRAEGFDVSVAGSVKTALDQDIEAVDLVLSDIGLEDGTGLEVMRELRRRKNVKGIVLSGFATESDILASRAAGFSVHLVKPVTLDNLMAAIRSVQADQPVVRISPAPGP
ncbi:MAG TPA: ATP-binding protein [Polyangia bacterium]|jgi:K+-sensing histidine kinase KdpD/ActR/RegA family two-component response regulator